MQVVDISRGSTSTYNRDGGDHQLLWTSSTISCKLGILVPTASEVCCDARDNESKVLQNALRFQGRVFNTHIKDITFIIYLIGI